MTTGEVLRALPPEAFTESMAGYFESIPRAYRMNIPAWRSDDYSFHHWIIAAGDLAPDYPVIEGAVFWYGDQLEHFDVNNSAKEASMAGFLTGLLVVRDAVEDVGPGAASTISDLNEDFMRRVLDQSFDVNVDQETEFEELDPGIQQEYLDFTETYPGLGVSLVRYMELAEEKFGDGDEFEAAVCGYTSGVLALKNAIEGVEIGKELSLSNTD